MFHLEDRLNQETLGVPVVSTKRQHFPKDAAPWLSLNVDDKVNGFCDLGFGVGEGGLRVVAHDQIGETTERFLCGIGMNRRERTRMAGVERIKQGSRLDSTYFAKNDAVRSPAQGGLQKVIERDVGLERVSLAFGRHNVRLLDVKLGGVLDDHDAIVVRNEVCQYPQKRGLAGPRSTTDEQSLSAANLLAQKLCK